VGVIFVAFCYSLCSLCSDVVGVVVMTVVAAFNASSFDRIDLPTFCLPWEW